MIYISLMNFMRNRLHWSVKKIFLYSGVLLSMLSFASCDDSFNDWAELKTNETATNGAYGLKKRRHSKHECRLFD